MLRSARIGLALLLAAIGGPVLGQSLTAQISDSAATTAPTQQAAQPARAAAATAIRSTLQRYADTVNLGDLDGWMALWAPGGVRMAPGAPMAVGLDTIRATMVPAMTLYNDVIRIDTLEVTVAGDWGYARGTYTLDAWPREDRRGEVGNGGSHVDGKFLTVFQHQPDGSWKIYRDIFNSNVPPS